MYGLLGSPWDRETINMFMKMKTVMIFCSVSSNFFDKIEIRKLTAPTHRKGFKIQSTGLTHSIISKKLFPKTVPRDCNLQLSKTTIG